MDVSVKNAVEETTEEMVAETTEEMVAETTEETVAETTEEASVEGEKGIFEKKAEEKETEKPSGFKQWREKNKKATQYDGPCLLLMLFCIAPLFDGVINRTMLVEEEIVYNAYKYNDYCIEVYYTIFVIILGFVLVKLLKLAKKHSLAETVKSTLKREPWLIFWGCLLIWSLAPTLNAIDTQRAFLGATELSSGYFSYLFSLSIMLCAYWTKEHERTVLLKFYVVISDVLALITLSFEYNIPFFKEFTVPITGLSVYTNQNHYGYYLAVAIMCMTGLFFTSLEEKNRNVKGRRAWAVVYLLSALANMYTLVLNDTLGAYLAVLFALVFLMVIWRIRFGKMNALYFVPIVFLGILTVLSYTGMIMSKAGNTVGFSLVAFLMDIMKVKRKESVNNFGTGRLRIWKETIGRIMEHPILGYGPDMMFDFYGDMLLETTPHNEFLECAFFLGIPGLVLYMGGLIKLCVDRCKGLKKLTPYQLTAAGVVLGYLISSFFGVRKFNTSTYLYMFLGMLMLEKGQNVVEMEKR